MAIGNNLMINPPRTESGLNVIQAARAAAEKTGDAKKEDKKGIKEKEQEHEKQVADKSDGANKNSRKSTDEDEEETRTRTALLDQENKDALINQVSGVGDTENPYVKKLYKDKSETQQIGWLYESLSPNSRNYANVVMPLNTQLLVVVTQDMQTSSWNFSAGKPQGQIVINQNYR
jgi:hypothetical protein